MAGEQMTAEEREAAIEFSRKVVKLSNTLSATSQVLAETHTNVDAIKSVLARDPKLDPALENDVRAIELKLLDMFYRGTARKEYMQDDMIDLIHVYFEALGGARHYARQPDAVKYICCGRRRGLILKKFRSVRHLCHHLETMHM